MPFRVFRDFKTLSVEYGNSNIIFKCFFVARVCFVRLSLCGRLTIRCFLKIEFNAGLSLAERIKNESKI